MTAVSDQSITGTRRQKSLHSVITAATLLLFFLVLILGVSREAQAAERGFVVENGSGYFYDSDGSRHTGWLWYNGRKYLFDENGKQVTGWQSNHYRYFNNTPGEDGYMVTGLYQDTDGKVYYFRPSTGVYARGWVNFNGKYRYFSNKGVMYTGIQKVGKYYYYFAGNVDYTLSGFRWQNGFRYFTAGRYYFSPKNGRGNVGWLEVDGNLYYTNIKGKCYVGVYKVGRYNYYFLEDGAATRGTWNTFNGKTYYFNLKDGHGHIGLLHLNGEMYYFTNKGVLYTNQEVTVNGAKYYAGSDGKLTLISSAYDYTPYYTSDGDVSYVVAHDANGRDYYLAHEFMSHPGIADGSVSDRDLLAALCESEAGDQGLIGMEAAALTVLNRTIHNSRTFPTELRYVIYQTISAGASPQYSVVRYGGLLRCLNGNYYNRDLAYQAADEALAIFNAYKASGVKRYLPGFDRDDFNFIYFMMESVFWNMNLSFDRVDYYLYGDHMFFVNWV